MRPEERQKFILETAKDLGFVSMSEAAKALNVSLETVRRDINALAEKGQLKKARGGASPLKSIFRKDGDYSWRIRNFHQKKIIIGAEAAKLIKDNMFVAVSPGTSMEAMASMITDVKNVTFVINDIKIAEILLRKIEAEEIDGRILFIGGLMDGFSTKGTPVIDEIDKYHFDIAFVACTALSEAGASLFDIETSYYSQHLMKRSTYSVLLAESDKVNKESTHLISELSNFDRIIIDNGTAPSDGIMKALENAGTELVIVS